MPNISEKMQAYRNFMSDRFLRGEGIEIGALDSPTRVREGMAVVRYMDYFSLQELKVQYPELDFSQVVPPDIVGDGEVMQDIQKGELDFIVANHFLEHTEDLIGTVKTHMDRLRAGGILFYAIPDKRFSFDRLRPTTAIGHFMRDFLEGPECSRRQHYLEWETLITGTALQEMEGRIQHLMESRYRIHFHVFELESVISLFMFLTEHVIAFEVEHIGRNDTEILVILRKSDVPRLENPGQERK